MTSFLVTYGTGQGQTAKVAHYVDSVLTERGHDVTTTNIWDVMDTDVDGFDAVLVGGPINNQRQLPEVTEFVERHREALAERPSGFFQLSIASALPYRWAQRGAEESVDGLIEETGWRPDRVGLFAGTVAYTKYDRFTRIGFWLASLLTTGDTDTSRDYEYTDWDAVERFAIEFAEFAETRRADATRERGVVAGLGRGEVAAVSLVVAALAVVVYRLFASQRLPRSGRLDEPPDLDAADAIDRIEV